MIYVFLIVLILIIPQIYYCLKEHRYKSLSMASKYFVRTSENERCNEKHIYLTNTDGFDLYVKILTCDDPKGIFQIVHGMSEHSGNYLDFARFLNKNGYIVAIADHRGHGRSLNINYPNGYMRRAEELIDDQIMLAKYLKENYPDLNLYMLGHSMGSMIARLFLRQEDLLIDKLFLTGTVPINPLSGLGLFFANIICFYFGDDQESGVIDYIVGAGHSIDFISYNEDNIYAKENDSMRIFKFKLGYSRVLIELNKKLGEKNNYKVKNKNLEIYNMVGADDPITKGQEAVERSLKFLNNLGYEKIHNKIFSLMKHEILNEKDNKSVYQAILKALES